MQLVKIKRFLLLLLISYLAPWVYCVLSQLWCEHGGASSSLNSFEYPYIVLLCCVLYFNGDRSGRVWTRYICLPSLTIVGLYVLYDLFYMYFKRSPRLSDFENYFSIIHVSIYLFLGLTFYCLVLFVPTGYAFFKSHQSRLNKGRTGYYFFRVAVILAVLSFPYSDQFYGYQTTKMHFDSWSETRNVVKNGRFGSFIYYHNQRKDVLKKISELQEETSFTQYFQSQIVRPRNIHIIVLESFIDPRLIEGLEFSKLPVSSELTPFLLNQKSFSTIKLPVYGGGSPQSEFEILTGLPAMARISSVEFNVFEGTATPGLIKSLKNSGYYSMVAKGSKPGFYNSTNAYKGFGFDEIHYRGKSYYQAEKGDDYIFDGDLFQANFSYLQENFFNKEMRQPVINYVVGMYGHLPFERNTMKRPDVIKTNSSDPLMHNLANQFYYRTEALGIFLKQLQKKDRNALVFFTSDHLPPIFQKGRKYKPDNYFVNVALLLDGFKPIDISGQQLHQISHVLWGMLGEKQTLPAKDAHRFTQKELEGMYLSLMKSATGM